MIIAPPPRKPGLVIGASRLGPGQPPVATPNFLPVTKVTDTSASPGDTSPKPPKKRAAKKEKEPPPYTGLPLLTEELDDPMFAKAPSIPPRPAVAATAVSEPLPFNKRLVLITDSSPTAIMETIGRLLTDACQKDNLQVIPCSLGSAANPKPLPQLYQGDTVLLMGSTACKRLAEEWGALTKGKSASSYRHQEIPFNGVTILTTHSAFLGTKDYTKLVDIQLDCMSAIRRATTGTIRPTWGLGHYEWVTSFEELCHQVHNQYQATGQPVRLSWDLECTGLNEYDPLAWIVSIFFSFRPGHSVGMAFGWHHDQPVRSDMALFKCANTEVWDKKVAIWNQIEWLLNTPMVYSVGANLKFDKRWISVKWQMDCTNHRFDTTLVGGLLDENVSNSLNNHTKIYAPELGGYDDLLNTTEDKGRMDLALAKDPDKFLVYAGGDTDAALRVYGPLRERLLANPRLANLYVNLLHPASDFFCRLEQVGVLVDLEGYRELEVTLKNELARLQKEADDLFPGRLRAKHKYDTSLTKAAVISDYMFSELGLKLRPLEYTDKTKNTETPKPTVAYTHLVKFKHIPEVAKFLEIFKAYLSASKTLSTYVTGFLEHLRPDNRFHATYLLHKSDKDNDTTDQGGGTVTGRLACTAPAMQTIPSKTTWAKPLRKNLIAPEGWRIVEIDYSQGELRVAAVVARVRTMIDAYNNNEDLHVIAGSLACGLDPEVVKTWKYSPDPARQAEYKFIRTNGKAANFGLLYGMQAEGYMNYARDSYGVEMTLDQAVAARTAFFDLYPELLEWHVEYQRMAARQGYIVSPLGRVRHLPFINSRDNSLRSQSERQAINSPIQATLSDMTVLSGVEFENNYGKFGKDNPVRFCMMVHDALYFYVREDDHDIWVPRVAEVMENLPLAEKFGWYNIPLKFVAEAESGPNLGAKSELKWSAEYLQSVCNNIPQGCLDLPHAA